MQELDNVVGIGPLRPTQSDSVIHGFSDLFSTEPTETSLTGHFQGSYPANVTDCPSGPYTILIPEEGPKTALDMSSIRSHLKIKLQKYDATESKWVGVTMDDGVGVVNNITGALWRRCEVFINHNSISSMQTPSYHYRSYLEKLLNYSKEAVKTSLTSGLWQADGTDSHEFKKVAGTDSWSMPTGMKGRTAKLIGGETVHLTDILHTELSSIGKYLPPGTNVKLQFERNSDDFVLVTAPNVSATKFRINIVEFWITINRVQVHDKLLAAWKAKFEAGEFAQYPMVRSIVKTKAFAKGLQQIKYSQVFTGEMPFAVMAFITTGEAEANGRTKNPYYFHHHYVNSAELTTNSATTPTTRLKQDFEKDDARGSYRAFLDAIGVKAGTNTPDITYKMWTSGATVWAWDLTPDQCCGFHRHFTTYGALSIDFGLAKPISEVAGVTLNVIGLYHDTLYIKSDKMVVYQSGSSK